MTHRTFRWLPAIRAAAAALSAVLLLVMAAGCSSKPGNVWSTVPDIAPASPVVFQQRTGKLALAPVAVTLPERRSIGTYSRNVGCWVLVRQLTDADFPAGEPLTAAAAQALSAARLTVANAASGGISAAAGNDYLLTGIVVGAHADMCNNTFLENGANEVSLELDVNWKLASVSQNRVVFETSTSGIGHSADKDLSLEPAAAHAMEDAVSRLLQTATAQQYLTFGHLAMAAPLEPAYPTPVGSEAAVSSSLPLPAEAAVPEAPGPPLLIPVTQLLPAGRATPAGLGDTVVTISVEGQQGTGFILSPAGYILADMAPLGQHAAVDVTFKSGERQQADVIRRNDALGLVLLKLRARTATSALPIEPRVASAGTPIYGWKGNAGLVSGRLVRVSSGGSDLTASLKPLVIGSPILDQRGSVLGIVVVSRSGGGAVVMPIGSVFSRLQLGASFFSE